MVQEQDSSVEDYMVDAEVEVYCKTRKETLMAMFQDLSEVDDNLTMLRIAQR